MDKIRELVKPDEFSVFKVTKTTLEFVRFEAEIENKSKLERVISKINNKMIKLKDFSDLMRVKACEWKSDFPNRRVWDDFFQNARDMDEMKPGERPDTVHISNCPTRWFMSYHLPSEDEDAIPSEKILYRMFEKFGSIRHVDIPICDPYRKKMKDHISGLKNSSFDTKTFFEGYVQYKDYIGFTKAMDTLRNMKLVKKEEDGATAVNIKVDFDRSKHLSDASLRRREIVRDRLVKKAREKEEKEKAELVEKKRIEELERQKEVDVKAEKEQRRKLREERRKAKILEKLEVSGADEINEKIAKEEKKLLKVQRKLEAIRLVEELFRRIAEKRSEDVHQYKDRHGTNRDELKRYKNASELAVLNQREKLHNAVKGRVMLKSILAGGTKTRNYSSSSETSLSLDEETSIVPPASAPVLEKYPELLYNPHWLGFPYSVPPAPMYGEFANIYSMRGFAPRGRPFPRIPIMPGTSRGRGYNRRRGNYYPRYRGGYQRGRHHQLSSDFEDDYREHDGRSRRSRSYSQRRSRSRSSSRRRRSYTPSRSRSRSRHGNRSRSRSDSRESRSRTKHRSYSRSRSRSSRRSSRPKEKSSHSDHKKTKPKQKSHSRETSNPREKSVDSTKFMTPKELHQVMSQRTRSKSWSLPKEGSPERSSWSKSPERKD